MRNIIIFLSCFIASHILIAQDTTNENVEIPYRTIPEAPASYTAGTVMSRMVDGLGFRFYWASEQLTDAEMTYKISEDSRSFGETMDHIYGLCNIVVNAVNATPNIRPSEENDMSWQEKRNASLINLKKASDILRSASSEDPENMKIIFQRGDKTSELPLWNLINGPVADAINHVGQILSYRRANGNPQPPGVNVLMGTSF